MTTITSLLTAEDVWNMPENGGRTELDQGELQTMSPANYDHGALVANLSSPMHLFVKSNKLGDVLAAETGFILARNPDTMRAPDIAFVSRSRIPASGRPRKFFEGAPDLAVEVLSPGDSQEAVERKVGQFLQAGCHAVWIVNPFQQTVAIHSSNAPVVLLAVSDTLYGDPVLPGFAIPVADIFA